MRILRLFLLVLFSFAVLNTAAFAQNSPGINFTNLTLNAENNFDNITQARLLAGKLGYPTSIYLEEGVFIDALGVEDGQPVYAVYYNLSNPPKAGETAFYSTVQSNFNLSNARIHYANGEVINPTLGFPEIEPDAGSRVVSFLMIPESTNKRVMAFDATTGDLIDMDFIPPDDVNLTTPIEPLLTPAFTVLISDQVDDAVRMYDTSGAFLATFYGNNTAVLDNIRGMDFTPLFASLVVTVGGGTNMSACAEFDPFGTYVGNFIAIGAGGLDSPFDIMFRSSDCLVAGINSDAIHQYDLSGNSLGIFASINSFPEQIAEKANGDIVVANFSGTEEGIVVYSSTGTLLNNFSNASYGGPRGVYELGNGNFLVTNGSGVHEVNGTTGAFIRTVVAGVSGRFISPFDPDAVPVELTSFKASVNNGSVLLTWETATETNNSGFAIERSADKSNFTEIGFVNGQGTTTEKTSYSFTDDNVNTGAYYYRLKQVDLDGSFSYSSIAEIEISIPNEFTLNQNYPNPFNPTTTITFGLPVESNVSVRIFNIVGQELASIAQGSYTAGTHNIEFNAKELSSGIYFYRLEANGIDGSKFISTKKMTILK